MTGPTMSLSVSRSIPIDVCPACGTGVGAFRNTAGTAIELTPIFCPVCGALMAGPPPVQRLPINIIDKLPWNNESPYPFPTQGKPAPVERKKYITLHHAASRSVIGWWNTFHTQTKLWPHVGYHFGIAPHLFDEQVDLYQLNRIGEFSWHDARNHDTVGVCLSGDLRAGHDDAPTERQIELLAHLLVWLVPQMPNFVGVIAHKSIQSTACPGDIHRWGKRVEDATRALGLDLEGRFNITLPRRRFSRLLNLRHNKAHPTDYEGV